MHSQWILMEAVKPCLIGKISSKECHNHQSHFKEISLIIHLSLDLLEQSRICKELIQRRMQIGLSMLAMMESCLKFHPGVTSRQEALLIQTNHASNLNSPHCTRKI